MAKVILRGWRPESEQHLIPLVKALREHLGCSLPEAVDLAEQCTFLGQAVTREEVPAASAQRLSEQLGSLAFDIEVVA